MIRASMEDHNIDKKNPKIKDRSSNSSCFLSCFGFSDRDDQKYLPEIIVSNNRKKSRRWFSCDGFRMKKSVKETISVYNPPIFKKIEVKKQIKEVKFDDKVTGKRQIPVAIDRKPGRFAAIVAMVSDQTPGAEDKPKKEKYGTTQNKNLEPSQLKTDTCHKQISNSRRTVATKPAGSQPDSPVKNSILHSSSFSRTSRHPKSTNFVGHFPVVGQKSGGEIAGKFGPMTGMSVLIVALAIMLLWGRICAIFCSAAWLYFVQYFKTRVVKSKKKTEENRSNSVNFNFDSKEYKKKVILEGLLDREHLWSLK